MTPLDRPSALDRILRLFADVRPGEGRLEVLLALNVFLMLTTVRTMLFLPCTREEKYSAKQAIDSFFFRMGDVVSAAIVFAGTHAGLAAAGFNPKGSLG